jgi:release factor glutamine methyltransferase
LALGASNILDIGTGSGAIGVTLSLETRAHVVCADISEAALRVASKNALRLGSSAEFVVCDLGAAFASHSFDLVVSNPPYIPVAGQESLQREVRDYEPHLALFGGLDGLDVYRRLIPEAARLLKPGGHLILEIGSLAADRVGAMLGEWTSVETKPDLAGIPRVVTASHQ